MLAKHLLRVYGLTHVQNQVQISSRQCLEVGDREEHKEGKSGREERKIKDRNGGGRDRETEKKKKDRLGQT